MGVSNSLSNLEIKAAFEVSFGVLFQNYFLSVLMVSHFCQRSLYNQGSYPIGHWSSLDFFVVSEKRLWIISVLWK